MCGMSASKKVCDSATPPNPPHHTGATLQKKVAGCRCFFFLFLTPQRPLKQTLALEQSGARAGVFLRLRGQARLQACHHGRTRS